MFIPQAVFFEKNIEDYELGKNLIKKYKEKNVPFFEIENHNNIDELRKKENSEFKNLKRNLIIGVRKTHKYVENHKVSDFLVPYTSSGCTAMCLYCYLVCNFNKCSYLRLFVNREQMLDKIISKASQSERNLTFEIGSNSDLILENTITNNLVWTIENFSNTNKGMLTFPTKFDMVEPILNLNHNGKIIVRMSVNPQNIIKEIEVGTSSLKNRVAAINKLAEAGYKIGILIAPVIFVENWKFEYEELIKFLQDELFQTAKSKVFFEVIFMTYSYVHKMINADAFPEKLSLYDKDKMTMRGYGKYAYKKELKQEGEIFFRTLLQKYFPQNNILYIC
ncbi:MAG: spore photoproduct lyase [Clostridia bacterium]|nr:spore photoproduct lyase [Clostridia bacterium]